MRSVREIRGVLAIGAPALLLALVGVGCRSDPAVGQGRPVRASAEPVATVVEDRLLPGDQRLPHGPTTVTTFPRRPIARPVSPVPPNRTPVTRTRPVFPGVETTTTITATTTITKPAA